MNKRYYALLIALILLLLGSSHPVSALEAEQTQSPILPELLYEGVPLMPSTGNVNMLVLPIAFPDYPQLKEYFAGQRQKLYDDLFAPYDPTTYFKGEDLSVRGFYYYSSYGKLDITGEILPCYDAPQPSTYYLSSMDIFSHGIDEIKISRLIEDALSSYAQQGVELSKFDSDNDGRLDAIIFQPLWGDLELSVPAYAHFVYSPSIIEDSGVRCGRYVNMCLAAPYLASRYDYKVIAEHEIAHLMGLPDNYPQSGVIVTPTTFPSGLNELTAASAGGGIYVYINSYYKYLLGWLEPVILTEETPVTELELFPMDGSGDPADPGPRAVVLTLEEDVFPLGEFYLLEYRAGGWQLEGSSINESIFEKTPGVVIWHGNTILPSRPEYFHSLYLRPVFDDETISYTADDVYREGDLFSPDTAPDSSFLGDVYTGAYAEVTSLTPEKATLRVGFQEHPILPKPEVTISGPSVPELYRYGSVSFTITATADGEPIELDLPSRWEEGKFPYCRWELGGKTQVTPLGEVTFDRQTGVLTINDAGDSNHGYGDKDIWLSFPSGFVQYNGKNSAPVRSREVVRTDKLQPQAPFSIDPIEGEVHFGDPPFRLTTSGGSGTGKVVFTAKCPPLTTPISVDSDGLVHFLAPGQAKVLAKKEGSTYYQPSEEAEILITVLPQSLESLTVTVPSVVYDGTAQTPAFTVKDMNYPLGGSIAPGKHTYTVSYRDNVEPGTGYVILTAPDTSYYSGTKTVPFTIEKAVPKYTLPTGMTAVYGQTLSHISLPPGFAWEEAGDTPVGEIGRRRIHKASYTPEDTRHYRTVTGLNVSLIVTSAPLTVKAENCSIAFGEEVPSLGYRITGFAPGEGPELLSGAPELTTDYRPGDPMGNYPIRVSQGTLTGPVNYLFTYEEGTLSVGLSRQEPLTAERCGEKTYGDAPFQLAATGGSGTGSLRWQVVEGDAVTVTAEGLATVRRAGSAQVRVEKAGDTAYAPAVSEPMTITVNKAPLTVTAEDVSVDQGDSLPSFSYRVTGLVGEDRLLTPPTFTCAATDSAAAGSWPITPAGADAGENYTLRYQPGTLTVRAKADPPTPPPVNPDPPVTPDPPGGGGGGGGGGDSAPTSYTVSLPGKVQGGTVSISPTRAEAGKTITLTVTAEEGWDLSALTATDRKGKPVELTAGAEGRYTFSMPGSNVALQVVFSKRSTPPEPEGPLPLPFIDVKEGDWFAPAVRSMYERGVMGGVEADRFGPHLPASRAMAVTILYRMEGEPEVERASFSDVPPEEYYARAVAWAAEKGLVNGYGDGSFRPNGNITREQLAALLYRYAALKGWDQGARTTLEGYMDVEQVSSYAVPALEWATAAGLVNGTDWGGLAPQTETSRAELAAILDRMLSAFSGGRV